ARYFAGEVYGMVQNLGADREMVHRLAMRYRDAKATEIYEGANEIQRIFVIASRVLKQKDHDYQEDLQRLGEGEDQINEYFSGAISRIIGLRNDILAAYREGIKRQKEENPSRDTLRQIGPFHLPDVEMKVMLLLLGYEAYRTAQGDEQVVWQASLTRLIQETIPILSGAIRNLPFDVQGVLGESIVDLQKLAVTTSDTQSRDGGTKAGPVKLPHHLPPTHHSI
ncbi:MAG: hypothetical protein ABH845_05365, partial [Candidatus Omnitrophota bacterium]